MTEGYFQGFFFTTILRTIFIESYWFNSDNYVSIHRCQLVSGWMCKFGALNCFVLKYLQWHQQLNHSLHGLKSLIFSMDFCVGGQINLSFFLGKAVKRVRGSSFIAISFVERLKSVIFIGYYRKWSMFSFLYNRFREVEHPEEENVGRLWSSSAQDIIFKNLGFNDEFVL